MPLALEPTAPADKKDKVSPIDIDGIQASAKLLAQRGLKVDGIEDQTPVVDPTKTTHIGVVESRHTDTPLQRRRVRHRQHRTPFIVGDEHPDACAVGRQLRRCDQRAAEEISDGGQRCRLGPGRQREKQR